MGGGWGLIFCCDIRICIDSAWFQFSEVKHGVVPALISAFITPELGPYWTKHWMLTGEKIEASYALERGILTHVSKSVIELDEMVQKYTKMLSCNGPQAMGTVKSLIRSYNSDHDQHIRHVKKVFEATVHSEEAKYGMECFKKKILPNWHLKETDHPHLVSKL